MFADKAPSAVPYILQKDILRQYLSPVLTEKLKKVKFCRRKLQQFPAFPDNPFFKINVKIAARITGFLMPSPTPSKNRLYLLHGNLNPEGLRNIILRAHVITADNLILQIMIRQKNKRYLIKNGSILRKLKSAAVRQIYIQHD